jgi:hypothetical protein
MPFLNVTMLLELVGSTPSWDQIETTDDTMHLSTAANAFSNFARPMTFDGA